jgi:hypothetical protein
MPECDIVYSENMSRYSEWLHDNGSVVSVFILHVNSLWDPTRMLPSWYEVLFICGLRGWSLKLAMHISFQYLEKVCKF